MCYLYFFCLHCCLISIHLFDYPDSRLSGLFTEVPTSPDNWGSTVQQFHTQFTFCNKAKSKPFTRWVCSISPPRNLLSWIACRRLSAAVFLKTTPTTIIFIMQWLTKQNSSDSYLLHSSVQWGCRNFAVAFCKIIPNHFYFTFFSSLSLLSWNVLVLCSSAVPSMLPWITSHGDRHSST